MKELIELRQKFHKIPEHSHSEHQTAKLIEELLAPIKDKIKITRIRTAVIVDLPNIETNNPTVIGARLNMDGLRGCNEKTGLGHSSTIENHMHACGHDIELALGVSLIKHFTSDDFLNELRSKNAQLRFIFQPAEEGPGSDELQRDGGLFLADEGVFENCDALFSFHVDPDIPLNTICAFAGAATVSAFDFEITINGESSHLSRPHEGTNPIHELARLIYKISNGFKEIKNGINPESEYFVAEISQVSSGLNLYKPLDAEINTLPAEAVLKGSTRVLGHRIEKQLEKILQELNGNSEIPSDLLIRQVAATTINNPELVDLVLKAAITHGFNTENTVKYWKDAAGWTCLENHPKGAKKVCHAYIGCGKDSGKLHTSTFYPPESVLDTGFKIFSGSILEYLNRVE